MHKLQSEPHVAHARGLRRKHEPLWPRRKPKCGRPSTAHTLCSTTAAVQGGGMRAPSSLAVTGPAAVPACGPARARAGQLHQGGPQADAPPAGGCPASLRGGQTWRGGLACWVLQAPPAVLGRRGADCMRVDQCCLHRTAALHASRMQLDLGQVRQEHMCAKC